MGDNILSEHKRRLSFVTIVILLIVGTGALAGIFGVGLAVFLLVRGKVSMAFGIYTIILGCPIGGMFGFLFYRYVTRIYSIRSVRIIDGNLLEVTTWRDKSFIVKPLDNVTYMFDDNGMVIAVCRIGKHYITICGSDFTDRSTLNEFLMERAKSAKQQNQ